MQVAVGHANPDFDAYAATIAATKLFPGSMGVYLGSQNHNVREFHTLHKDLLDFVDLKDLDVSTIERIIMVDTREPGRIGELGVVATDPAVDVIVYDHHPSSGGDIQGADDRSRQTGAATSILVHEIRDRGIELAPIEASAMLIGIHEDTGSLTYPNTTAMDAEAVAYLMGCGADLEVVAQFLSRGLDSSQRTLLDGLLADLRSWDVNGQTITVGVAKSSQYVDAVSVVTHNLCEDMGHSVVIAVIEMPDRVHVVGRSRLAEVDIGAVLARVGGGGHSQAASASLRPEDAGDILKRLRVALEATVRAPLRAGDIGTHPVRTVGPETPMSEAGETMKRWGHGGLPVVEGAELVGIVTRKDFDKAVRHGLQHAPVKGFMGREVVTVPPDMGLDALERLLIREGIGRVPVVADGHIEAIITRKDLLRAKHGDEYLDRGMALARSDATKRFMSSVGSLLPADVASVMRRLGHIADEMGVQVHVVGGFVRDMLLGRENMDVDVVVEGDGISFAEVASERLGARFVAHRRFNTAILVLEGGRHVDVASARTEYYTRPGALPTVERSSLRQDLLRRDFSVNAMAACINPSYFGAIVDPFGGLRDLEQGLLRVLHSLSFVEDPTRVFRGARFECRYGFVMEASTEALARQCVEMGLLDEVSGARIREELSEILDESDPVPALARLDELGALGSVIAQGVDPAQAVKEVHAVYEALSELSDVWSDEEPDRHLSLLLPLAASTSHREAEHWALRLRLGREVIDAVVLLADHLEQVMHSLKDSRRFKSSHLYRLLEPLSIEALVYMYAVSGAKARKRVVRFLSEISCIQIKVTGQDLIALGLEPGPEFSDILERARDARLDGKAVGRDAELANLERIVRRMDAAR